MVTGIIQALSVLDRGILLASTLRQRAAQIDHLVKQAQLGIISPEEVERQIQQMQTNLEHVETLWNTATQPVTEKL